MKYLIALLFLTSCTPIAHEAAINKLYPCTFFNAHGSYAKVFVWSPTIESAKKQAESVRLRLTIKNIIPEDSDVMCELPEESK